MTMTMTIADTNVVVVFILGKEIKLSQCEIEGVDCANCTVPMF